MKILKKKTEKLTNRKGITHKDSSTGTEKTVEIPAGFAVSQVEGENTIEDGLVIIDKNEVAFTIERGEYSLDDGANINAVNGKYKKENSVPVLLTTGANERNKVLNIYDYIN